MKKEKISIHQPTFFPWYPFFQKIQESNTFVFLTLCQYEKNGYQNRFDIDKKWYTMSTFKGLDPLVEKRYVNPQRDWKKIKKSLEHRYGKEMLSNFDKHIGDSLVETNISIITEICEILEIETVLKRDFSTDTSSTTRLVEICSHYNAASYLSGIGGKNYLKEEEFLNLGIDVFYQEEDKMIKEPIFEILSKRY